jgi:tRNA(Ile)-lysidine synthase
MTVAATARKAELFHPGEHLLVCVSGGPDSVCLLAVLQELAPVWRLTLSVAHFNHRLRGTESDEDAAFVADLCQRTGLPCHCEAAALDAVAGRATGKTRTGARASMQERARAVRYAAIEALARRVGATRIATGHTADDQAETLLLWMLRGAGTAGLAGIPQTRDGLWIRPFLGITRAAILTDLAARGLAFRTDTSNAKPIYLRNRVRHELLPVLMRLNPGIVKVLGRQARLLRDEDRCLEELTDALVERLVRRKADGAQAVEHDTLLTLTSALQRRVVRAVLRQVAGLRQGPSFGAVEAVLERVARGRSGAKLTAAGILVLRDRRSIRFHPRGRSAGSAPTGAAVPGPVTVTVPPGRVAAVPWPWSGQTIRLTLVEDSGEGARKGNPASRNRAALDADKFSMPLTLRPWQPGDRFHPSGMRGKRKKLQDYFSDVKLPSVERRRIPILTAPEGILWIAGWRTDDRFRATAATTRVLLAELETAGTEGPERDTGE